MSLWSLESVTSLGINGVSPHLEKNTGSSGAAYQLYSSSFIRGGLIVDGLKDDLSVSKELVLNGISDLTIVTLDNGSRKAYYVDKNEIISADISSDGAVLTNKLSTGISNNLSSMAWGVPDAVVLPDGRVRIYWVDDPDQTTMADEVILSATSSDSKGLDFKIDSGNRVKGGYVDFEILRAETNDWIAIMSSSPETIPNKRQGIYIGTSQDGITWNIEANDIAPQDTLSYLDPTGIQLDGDRNKWKIIISSSLSILGQRDYTLNHAILSYNSISQNSNYDYLNFAPQILPARPNDAMAKFHDYVDRYPLTLKTAFIADYNAGKAPSQALWGQTHWFNNGQAQGRVLEVVTGQEDTNDYGAYVENYGTTLLDIYRASPASNTSNPDFMSLYNWGKWHYKTMGQAAGRQMDGGVDWGAIVKQNFDLNTKWKDAQIADPSMSAFSFGYNNQNTIKAANGVQIGRDTQEKLSGQYVYGLGGNDVLTGTSSDDLLHGGFGDDLIAHGNGGTDLVYGGPGKDVFQLHTGGTLQIRDFRKGTDFIQLGDGLTNTDVQLVFDSFSNSTAFKSGSETLALVYGTNPNDFSFAQQSEGIDNVFIA